MNILQLAIAGYETLLSQLLSAEADDRSDIAEAWLQNEVIPVCMELFENRRFRQLARWPLDQLTAGAAGEIRPLVEAVDAAIIDFTVQLRTVIAAEYPLVSNAAEMGFMAPREGLEPLEWIAARPWFDLVVAEEYFQPYRGLHLWAQERHSLRTVEAFSKLEMSLGDYVSRSLWARIDYWTALLGHHMTPILFGRQLPVDVMEQLCGAQLTLEGSVRRLRAACLTEDQPVREAAIVLVQVYSAFAPLPSRLDWLPCADGLAEANRGLIQLVIRRPRFLADESGAAGTELWPKYVNVYDLTILRQIAAALLIVRKLYEAPEDADDLVDWAKDRVRLLLVDCQRRAVYWDGAAIADGEWDGAPHAWNLLWNLAIRLNQPVDLGLLVKPTGEAIRSRRNRLGNLLLKSADTLESAIETVRRQGYRLNLDPQQVMLLQDDGLGQLIQHGTSRLAVP